MLGESTTAYGTHSHRSSAGGAASSSASPLDPLRRRGDTHSTFDEFPYPPYSELPFSPMRRRRHWNNENGQAKLVKWAMRAVLASPVVVLVVWSIGAMVFTSRHTGNQNRMMDMARTRNVRGMGASMQQTFMAAAPLNMADSNNQALFVPMQQGQNLMTTQQGQPVLQGSVAAASNQYGATQQQPLASTANAAQLPMGSAASPLIVQPRAAQPMLTQGQRAQATPMQAVQPLPVQGQSIQNAPLQGPAVQNMPVQGQAVQFTPLQAIQATPLQGQAIQDTPLQGQAVQATPLQGQAVQDTPLQGQAVQATPLQAQAVQDTPLQAQAVQDTPLQGQAVQDTPLQQGATQEAPLQQAPALTQEQAPAMGSGQMKPVYYVYDPKQLVQNPETGELQLPTVVYDTQGNAISMQDLSRQGSPIELQVRNSLTERSPEKRSMSAPIQNWGESTAQDQTIMFATVGIMALIVGAISARRARSNACVSMCIENENLEDDAAFDTAHTTTAGGASASYSTFGGGWKGDLEKFDV